MITEESSTESPTLSPTWIGRAPLYEEDYSTLTDTQDKILALLPLIPCSLSIWGSSNIIHMVVSSRKRPTPYRRILLALSVCDCINSIAFPFQSFLLPADTSQRVWAIGTDTTCTMLGWFNQFNFSSIWYSGMISIYFLLTVRFGKSEHWIATWVEPIMHLLAIGYPLVTATTGVVLGMYHEYLIGAGCWIYEYPQGCQDCFEFPDTTRPCCEGSFWGWIFGGLPTFVVLLVIAISNAVVYCHVRSTIKTSQQYLNSSLVKGKRRTSKSQQKINNAQQQCNQQQAKRIQAVGTQALLYVGAFAITYACALSFKIMESLDYNAQDEDVLFPGLVIQQLTLPGLGFLNCLVFVRPSYLRVRKRHPNESRFWAFRRALHGDKIRSSQTTKTASQQTPPIIMMISSSNNNNNNHQYLDDGNGNNNNDERDGEGGGGDAGTSAGPSSLPCPPICQDDQEEEEESMQSFEVDIPEQQHGGGDVGGNHLHNSICNHHHHHHLCASNNNNNSSNRCYHQSAPVLLFQGLSDFSAVTTRDRFQDVLFDSGMDLPQQLNDRNDNTNNDDNFLMKTGGHMSMPTILTINRHNNNEKRNARLQKKINSARRRHSHNDNNNKKVAALRAPAEVKAPASIPPPPPPPPSNPTTTTRSTSSHLSSQKNERRSIDSSMILSKELPIQRQQHQKRVMDRPSSCNNDNKTSSAALEVFADEEEEEDQQRRGSHHHHRCIEQCTESLEEETTNSNRSSSSSSSNANTGMEEGNKMQ